MIQPVRGTLALLLFLVAGTAGVSGGTREDLQRLAQDLQTLQERVGRLEQGLSQTQQALQQLSERVDALSRASQTADLRGDLDQIRRQVETLSEQVAALKLRGEQTPSLVPPLILQPPTAAVGPASAAPAVSPDLYAQAYADYLQGRYDLAGSEFSQFLAAFPSDAKAGNAQYWIGECLYSQKSYPGAKEAFQKVIDGYPEGSKADAARLKLGLTHLALDETAQGVVALKDLLKKSPDSPEAQIARERLKKLQSP